MRFKSANFYPEILGLAILGFALSSAFGAEGPEPVSTKPTVQPYIDQLLKNLPPAEKEGSYTELIQKSLPTVPAGSYIEELKREDPERFKPREGGTSWLQEQRALLPEKETGGAIAALREGRSELKAKYVGDIHHALGLRYGVAMAHDVTGNSETVLRPFGDIFGGNYVPDLAFFYEYQLGHHERLGSFGLVTSLGASYYYGNGKYKFNLEKPWAPGTYFGLTAPTQFQFFALPVSVAAIYRFNLPYLLRPFVMGGPSGVAYFETRNDSQDGHRGFSKGLYLAGGVSILMDWLSRSDSWDGYKSFGMRHSYLTIQYEKLTPLLGDVEFSFSGITAGATFEY